MIIRNKGTHYEVEMFHIINIGKDNAEKGFNNYLTELAQEFVKEINTLRFSIKTGLEYIPATTSHTKVEDGGPDIKPNYTKSYVD